MNRGGRLFFTFLVSSFFASIGPGCGSSEESSSTNASSGSTGGPSNSGGAEACARYIAARREAESACGGSTSPSRADEFFARHQRRCETMVGAPGSGVTAAVIDQCAADIRGTCTGDDACTRIIDDVHGTLAEGAGCVYDAQCASGACKKDVGPDGAAHCGKCLPVKQIGESCSEDSCVSGARCFPVIPDKPSELTCAAIREIAEGEPCPSSTGPGSCAKGLYCRAAVNGLSRICVRPVGEGETCGNSNGMTCAAPLTCLNERCSPRLGAGEPCDGGGCGKDLVCDSASKTCMSIVWLPIGSECDGKLRRCDLGYCFAPGASTGSATVGTCIDYVADGEACAGGDSGDGEPNGPACDVTAACRDKRCQLDDPSLCK